uniref:Uncharacterized protein n=1 Tax=Cajanus cajan TaxID=3821 RepID=A0A151TUM8_CAJCA|nr:hypothetical protein KK1_010015 [Cajanus cajan]
MAVSPTRVVRSLSSAKMRASTGKAVMESATPMKTRNCAKAAWSAPGRVLRRRRATPMPQTNGREIPTAAMVKALEPERRMARRSSSRPTRKRKKRSPMVATDSSVGVLHEGNIRCRYFLFLPSADGPSNTPPCSISNSLMSQKRKRGMDGYYYYYIRESQR